MTFQGTIEDLQTAVVVDRTGDKLGKVGQVYLDNDTHQPSWVTVNIGLFGTNESFIPLAEASYADGTITVPYEKSFVKDAPNIAEDGELGRDQEGELFAYYGVTGAAAGTGTGTGTGTGHRGDAAGRRDDAHVGTGNRTDSGDVTLHEERAHVGTEKVETGRVRLRKHVVTDTKQVEVPVQREEVVLEREPADGRTGGTLTDDEVEVTLTEERPVVTKETVATENVSLGKRAVTDTETVQTDVAREEVEIEDGTGKPRRNR
ncbi:DUF2382 domain-containing protein [Brachybacterium sp. UNK5269]|uniref:DUF2382 domain-containing protein n=1 Tax=Brachybacterium sp. UNK5269 TaxID=3408576 RepID=UPI003BAE2287